MAGGLGRVRRWVLTGAPGAGKTAVLQALATRGHDVVAEAATDVIAVLQAQGVDEPWTRADFCDRIALLQRRRQEQPLSPGTRVQVFDRSPLCTLALSRFLGRAPTPALIAEVDRVVRDEIYEPRVFLVRPLGAIEATAARRITYADSLRFEVVHQQVYVEHGFALHHVSVAAVGERAAMVEALIVPPPTGSTYPRSDGAAPRYSRPMPRPHLAAEHRPHTRRGSGEPAVLPGSASGG